MADVGVDGSRSSASTVADRLASALTDREAGWRLPRRSALAKRYGVGTGEIDAAIADLVRSSLIRRLPDGQLYRASTAGRWIPVEGMDGLGTRLDPMGNTISRVSRQVSQGEAPPDVTRALGQAPDAHLGIVRCVWSAGDDPVAVSVAYLPAAYLPGPEAGQQDDAPLPRPGAAAGPLMASAVSVEMSLPHPEVARALRVPVGQPVITVTVRFGAAADGGPAAVSVVTLKPELFRVAIDVNGV